LPDDLWFHILYGFVFRCRIDSFAVSRFFAALQTTSSQWYRVLCRNRYCFQAIDQALIDAMSLEQLAPFVGLRSFSLGKTTPDHTVGHLSRLSYLSDLVEECRVGRDCLTRLSGPLCNDDVACLSSLLHLRIADVGSQVGDEGISHLTGLTSLDLGANRFVTDLGLARLTALTFLDMRYNMHVTTLTHLTALTTLAITHPAITADQLSPLTRLRSLTLCYSNHPSPRMPILRLPDDATLSCMPHLTKLDLSYNRYVTGECFSALTALTQLNLNRNKVVEDRALVLLTNLTHLDIHRNRVISTFALLSLHQMRHLILGDYTRFTPISDTAFTNMSQLTYLNVCGDTFILLLPDSLLHLSLASRSRIRDIHLTHQTRLQSLYLRSTGLTGSCIASLTALTTLWLVDDPVPEAGLSSLTRLTDINVSSQTVPHLITQLLELPSLRVIRGLDAPSSELKQLLSDRRIQCAK